MAGEATTEQPRSVIEDRYESLTAALGHNHAGDTGFHRFGMKAFARVWLALSACFVLASIASCKKSEETGSTSNPAQILLHIDADKVFTLDHPVEVEISIQNLGPGTFQYLTGATAPRLQIWIYRSPERMYVPYTRNGFIAFGNPGDGFFDKFDIVSLQEGHVTKYPIDLSKSFEISSIGEYQISAYIEKGWSVDGDATVPVGEIRGTTSFEIATGATLRVTQIIGLGNAFLWWTKFSPDGNYLIERSSTGSDSGFSEIAYLSNGVTKYVDATAEQGIVYWYKVVVNDSTSTNSAKFRIIDQNPNFLKDIW